MSKIEFKKWAASNLRDEIESTSVLHKAACQNLIKAECRKLNEIIEELEIDAIDKFKSLIAEQQIRMLNRMDLLKEEALENNWNEVPEATMTRMKERVQIMIKEHTAEQ